jgi:hypothetical protein
VTIFISFSDGSHFKSASSTAEPADYASSPQRRDEHAILPAAVGEFSEFDMARVSEEWLLRQSAVYFGLPLDVRRQMPAYLRLELLGRMNFARRELEKLRRRDE